MCTYKYSSPIVYLSFVMMNNHVSLRYNYEITRFEFVYILRLLYLFGPGITSHLLIMYASPWGVVLALENGGHWVSFGAARFYL
jgi:hypothetical protein